MLSNAAPPTGLRWFQGKKHMSYIRGGDYTHPGEEQAILETLSPFPKDKNRLILDVACGLGGTANFIQKNGWGKVVGFDIEPASIEYAKQAYPDVEFHISDVADVSKTFSDRKFDMICIFSSFLVFNDQKTALENLRSIAKEDAQLVIFEYIDLMPVNQNFLVRKEPKNAAFLPLRLENLNEMLRETGWQNSQLTRMDNKFKQWYADLLARIQQVKDEFIKMHGEPEYKKILGRYKSFYDAFAAESLGGCVLYAQSMPALEHQHTTHIRCRL